MSKLNIFLSYKRGEQEGDNIAKEIENYLIKEKNYSVFRDIYKIEGGEPWKEKILKSIRHSDIVIVIITRGAVKSEYVREEIEEAQKWNKRIIPCRRNDVGIEELEWNLGKINVIKYSEDNHYELLLFLNSSIDAYLREKRNQLLKKIAKIVLPVITIVMATLIFYFFNLQVEYSYQYDKSIGLNYSQIFANLLRPSGMAVDNTGNILVADTGNNQIKRFNLTETLVFISKK